MNVSERNPPPHVTPRDAAPRLTTDGTRVLPDFYASTDGTRELPEPGPGPLVPVTGRRLPDDWPIGDPRRK